MHPLVGDLSKLTDIELGEKISELMKRLNQGYRMSNSAIVNQIQMMLENYRYEQTMRNAKMLAELEEKSKAFKDIIDIAK